jgi:NADH-quinone oxidoreductase subunit C
MADDRADAREEDHKPPEDELVAAIVERFPGAIVADSHGQIVVYVGPGDWHDLALLLRDEQRFTQCVDVTAVDHLVDAERWVAAGVDPERYEVVANFLSHPRNRRVRVICEVSPDQPEIPSIVDVYPGAAFAEREVFDLFGINFPGHDGLARILMPDDWIGHPLRKDDSPARVPVTFKEDPGPR